MFTLHITTRLQRDTDTYLINQPITWFNDEFTKILSKILRLIGNIDYTVGFNINHHDPVQSYISIYFVDKYHLLDEEKNARLLNMINEEIQPSLFEADINKGNQVYLYSVISRDSSHHEIYQQINAEHRLIENIVSTYIFEHPDTNTVLVYHSTKPLRLKMDHIEIIDGPYLQHFEKTVDTGIHLEDQLHRVSTYSFLQVDRVDILYSLYNLFKYELDTVKRLLNVPYVDQNNPETTDKDQFVKINKIFKFKPNDPHAIRLIEHSILHHQLPYYVVKTDSNNDDEIQYFYIDGSKTRYNDINKLTEKITDLQVVDLHQHSTDTKTVYNGYGIIHPIKFKSDEVKENELIRILRYLEDGVVDK